MSLSELVVFLLAALVDGRVVAGGRARRVGVPNLAQDLGDGLVQRLGQLVSDLQLEETDGLQLVEQLRTQLPNVPVILLTGVLFDAQVVEENLKWKISAYVSKTAPLQTLVQEIKRLLK